MDDFSGVDATTTLCTYIRFVIVIARFPRKLRCKKKDEASDVCV